MKRTLHAAAGALALLTISTFWVSTVLAQLLGTHATITTVKTAILYGLAVLVPAMATVGATGTGLARGWRGTKITAKQRRMKIIAANGLLI
ncbi:hypothetical protein AB9K41_01095, partial [Cribrihabitans sp. XS_ASV171]